MLSGEKLRDIRLLNHKTQQQVADWCNVSVRYVGMVEYGQEHLSDETYRAWLNCLYGIGKPLPKTPRCNQTAKKRKLAEKSKE